MIEKEVTLEGGLTLYKEEKKLLEELKAKKIPYQRGIHSLAFTYSLFGKPFLFRFYIEKKQVIFFSASYVFKNESDLEKEELEKKVATFLSDLIKEEGEKKENSISYRNGDIYFEYQNTPQSREGAFKDPNLFFRVTYAELENQEEKHENLPYLFLFLFLVILLVGILLFALLRK